MWKYNYVTLKKKYEKKKVPKGEMTDGHNLRRVAHDHHFRGSGSWTLPQNRWLTTTLNSGVASGHPLS